MSHQTGIQANEDLKLLFAQSKEGNLRVIKIDIIDEELTPVTSLEPAKDWETDFELVPPLLEAKKSCYLLYRLDTKNNLGYEWLFITYTPDSAPVRDKMLFAGTKATLKKEFGGGHVKDELLGSEQADVTLDAYITQKEAAVAPPPLTAEERELEDVKKQEGERTHINVSTKVAHMSGVHFPVNQQGVESLTKLQNKKIQYVQLKLNIEEETVELASEEDSVGPDDLGGLFPTNEARYHFYLFKHTHEGDYTESILFIYSMPGYTCGIKERMLYSSCKGPVVDFAEQQIGMEIPKKIGDKCWSHSECNVRECCAGVSTKTTGACAHQPQMGQKCFPWIHPRSKVHCPCILGTTCSGENYDLENTTRQFRCAKVVYEPDEEIESVNDFN